MSTLAWIGPVSASNLASVDLRGRRLVVLNEGAGGIRSSHFRQLARQHGSLRGAGLDGPDTWLAGWSAGGAYIDELLKLDAAPGVTSILCADGYYTSTQAYPELKSGYLAAARRCLRGNAPRRLWFTTGRDAGLDHLSSRDSLAPLARHLYLRGRVSPIGHGTAVGRGGVLWIDAPAFRHVKHATELAPAVLSLWSRGPADGDTLALGMVLGALGLAAHLVSRSPKD